jgi:hypothetical protein
MPPVYKYNIDVVFRKSPTRKSNLMDSRLIHSGMTAGEVFTLNKLPASNDFNLLTPHASLLTFIPSRRGRGSKRGGLEAKKPDKQTKPYEDPCIHPRDEDCNLSVNNRNG